MSRFFRSLDNYAVSNIGDEAVLVPTSSGVAQMSDMLNLNSTAAFILRLLEEGRSDDDIVTSVLDEYDAPDADTVREDVDAFISELISRGFFKLITEGDSSSGNG